MSFPLFKRKTVSWLHRLSVSYAILCALSYSFPFYFLQSLHLSFQGSSSFLKTPKVEKKNPQGEKWGPHAHKLLRGLTSQARFQTHKHVVTPGVALEWRWASPTRPPHTLLRISNQAPPVKRMLLRPLSRKWKCHLEVKTAGINSCEIFCGKVSVYLP